MPQLEIKLNQKNIGNKKLAIASDWNTLSTQRRSSKQSHKSSLTEHRLRTIKEITNKLNKYGHTVIYVI